MAEFPALPVWTDALLGDTMHLSNAEFGAYCRLLFTAWRRPDCNLPDDDVFLGRSVQDSKNWWRLKPVVMGFWTLGTDGFWRQKRLTAERARVQSFSAKQAGRAHKRWGTEPPVDNSGENENKSEFLPHMVRSDSSHQTGFDFIENNDLPNAGAYAAAMPSISNSNGNGISKSLMGSVGIGKPPQPTTIKDPQERLARFQKRLAESFARDGYSIVAAALDQNNPMHRRCLQLCKDQARSIGKGWPKQWPNS